MFKKDKIIYLIMLIIFFIFNFSCSMQQEILIPSNLEVENNEYIKQDNIRNIDIVINYPQIINGKKTAKCSKINTLLYDYFVIEPYDGLFYHSDYEIKLFTSEIISITKKTDYYVKGNPYPSSELGAININPQTLSVLNYNEILSNDVLLSAVKENKLSLIKGVNDLLEVYSYQELIDMFVEQTEKVYYVTDFSIGIIIYLNHASGDYALIEIPHEHTTYE